jgi:hypothetical protein
MGGLPFLVSHLPGRVHRQGDWQRTGRSAIAGVPAACGVRAWHAGGFVILAVRSAPPGRLDVVSPRVLGDEDHRHDKDREARDQPAEGRQRAGHAVWRCWSGSWRYFLQKRDRLAQAVAGPLAGGPAAGELVQRLCRNRTTSTMITMITIAPKLMNMGCSSCVCGAQDGGG